MGNMHSFRFSPTKISEMLFRRQRMKGGVPASFSRQHSPCMGSPSLSNRGLLSMDHRLKYTPHIKLLKPQWVRILDLIRYLSAIIWGAGRRSLHRLLTTLDYECIVYGKATSHLFKIKIAELHLTHSQRLVGDWVEYDTPLTATGAHHVIFFPKTFNPGLFGPVAHFLGKVALEPRHWPFAKIVYSTSLTWAYMHFCFILLLWPRVPFLVIFDSVSHLGFGFHIQLSSSFSWNEGNFLSHNTAHSSETPNFMDGSITKGDVWESSAFLIVALPTPWVLMPLYLLLRWWPFY